MIFWHLEVDLVRELQLYKLLKEALNKKHRNKLINIVFPATMVKLGLIQASMVMVSMLSIITLLTRRLSIHKVAYDQPD